MAHYAPRFMSIAPLARDVLLVHSSDVHVDTHAEDGTAYLKQVVATARTLAADVLMLAGDTFEHNRLPQDLVEAAARVMGEAGMRVVILPGNHDPAMAGSPFHRGGFDALDNVVVLGANCQGLWSVRDRAVLSFGGAAFGAAVDRLRDGGNEREMESFQIVGDVGARIDHHPPEEEHRLE